MIQMKSPLIENLVNMKKSKEITLQVLKPNNSNKVSEKQFTKVRKS